MGIRIILVDDHGIFRQGLCALLGGRPDMQVVGEAEDGRTAVRLVRELKPDVVVMDVRMPDLNGIDATRQALAAHPGVRVIALTAHDGYSVAVEILRAGASGYVLKEAAFEEVAAAIHAVVQGKVYLSPAVSGIVTDLLRRPSNGNSSAYSTLSPREREVLQLIAEGRSTKEIAYDIQLSVKTVETHRRNIMEKLHLDSVASLTKYAIREGLTSP